MYYTDTHGYGDKQSIQNMVAMFSLPFSQKHNFHTILVNLCIVFNDIDIYHVVTVMFVMQSIGIVWFVFPIMIISLFIRTS